MKITITEENRDEISLDREIKNDHIVLERLRNFTIDGVDFSFDGNADMLELNNCVDCKILNCTFHDRTKKGNFIHLRGEKSKRNLIENCTFKKHSSPESNGGEAIIIGLDDFSGCLFETTVRKCEFIKCRGDPEIISIKSVDNVIENNCIREDCDGNITVRHGGRNIIRNNVFEGPAGGIRILGFGNKVIGNYHKDNDNDSVKRRPLIIQNGLKKRDPNFDENDKPKNVKGDGATIAQARKNIIEDNIYDNCGGPKACVSWGWKQKAEEGKPEHKLKPQSDEFRRNILIADKKDSQFLKFINEGDDNKFGDNKMFGDKAKRGDLPEESVERLEDPPNIPKPDTRCAVP
jgi:Chondroitinase B